MANIPDTASDQITPPKNENARFMIKITKENKQPSTRIPAKHITILRTFSAYQRKS